MGHAKTPVTLVTGYLGSGKTTLINTLLALREATPGRGRIAVIVNEFGSVGVDGALIADVAGAGKVIELPNGCLCCVVTGEFREALESLPRDRLDHIVIETSGAADPTMVIKLLWGAPELTSRFRLDGVICVVDAVHFEKTVAADPVALLQASVADVAFITKVDSGAQALARVRALLTSINPTASVLEFDFARAGAALPAEELLGIDAYRRPQPLLRREFSELVSHGDLTSVAVSFDGELPPAELQRFFRELVLDERVVRTKALLRVQGEERHWLIQGVQSWIERGKAPKSYRGPNRLVVLGRGIDVPRLNDAIERLRQAAAPIA